jgi:hypothetical protein
VACYGLLQFADGELADRLGGNVSGILLTGIINCYHMDLTKAQTYSWYFGVPPDELWKHVKWSLTGDDSIDGYVVDPDLDAILELFNQFGTVYKLDAMADGSCYPVGLGNHVPYLGRVSVQAGPAYLTVPVEPRRNLGWYHTLPSQDDQKTLESWIGIRESLMPFLVANGLDENVSVPRVVEDFMKDFDVLHKRVVNDSRTKKKFFVQNVMEAALVCTPLWMQ